ncbi:MAG: hypothetical protein A3B96_04155 [Candidatus Spechtbacteria bacterium RIFCSPHIGHO2_02_FULL_43_15b]|uniref:Ada DNA repair metal-binding domain-containing protein n=1 Tax=Candidatus Spechtbacteria bacterium RIFCSPHIGHO2_01_FULL_43_30 TaxID=1802158 RepID=A0A1G2H4H0_9BACT|nr:MAG: hypothetical protein A2827_02140 [Candidatus Spechtbacteria bacterium RIFCSPHIGHO2_01_FULL_43_30]OGZ60413.1 MAG: hypothetical protein A3B96_04155 [Candidatus Spechtbacteria bacterium RIFCSPHIGHO2_02_FULL_43_15b]
MFSKIVEVKNFVKKNESDITLFLGVILISLISFAAGRLSAPGQEKQLTEVEYLKSSAFENITNSENIQGLEERTEGMYVASKNSSKYHLPDCPGADRISSYNKIWFISKEEAEGMGYEPASNCPGL